jgi:Ca2+-binding RTX toxin-like protein
MIIETLERRALLSATVSEGYPGFYEVEGTEDADAIDILVDMSAGSFTLDGTTYSGVNYILVNARAGDDMVDVYSPTSGDIACTVNGGDGSDGVWINFNGAIWGGPGDDYISLANSFMGEAYGDSGADVIYITDETVDAYIEGGSGDDFINATESGYGVTAYGGSGTDIIYGSEHADSIHGGAGVDYLYGNGGDDAIYAQNGVADYIYGGSGYDTVYADSNEAVLNGVEVVFN